MPGSPGSTLSIIKDRLYRVYMSCAIQAGSENIQLLVAESQLEIIFSPAHNKQMVGYDKKMLHWIVAQINQPGVGYATVSGHPPTSNPQKRL